MDALIWPCALLSVQTRVKSPQIFQWPLLNVGYKGGIQKPKYMAITKPVYRIVGLQEKKVGGKKKKPKQNLQS